MKEAPKMGQYEGLAIKPLHPKMKAQITKLGFRIDAESENKEILMSWICLLRKRIIMIK